MHCCNHFCLSVCRAVFVLSCFSLRVSFLKSGISLDVFFCVSVFVRSSLCTSVWVKLVGNRVAPISGIKGSDTAGGGGGGERTCTLLIYYSHETHFFERSSMKLWDLRAGSKYTLFTEMAGWWMFSIALGIRCCSRRWCDRKWSSTRRCIGSENFQPAPWRW